MPRLRRSIVHTKFATPLDKAFSPRHAAAMAFESDSPLDRLWQEYGRAFQEWDDLTLARWLAQTLGELEGRAWRLSHPLVGAYRLAAQLAHDRQVWFKRLATPPAAFFYIFLYAPVALSLDIYLTIDRKSVV
jgi:hypothetical protein